MTEVRDRIIRIVAEQAMLDPSELKLDMSPQDIGIDSLGLVESIFAIEEAFDISTLGAIVSAVEKLVAEKA